MTTSSTESADDVARLADELAAAVTACPAVSALATGSYATYLAGRVVQGIALRDDSVHVAIVATGSAPLMAAADQVRAAVAAILPGRAVDVSIEDIEPFEASDTGE